MLASACINNVFVSYYMEMFTMTARIPGPWFFAGQLIFMVWNCANDFIFGWLSDQHLCHSRARKLRGLERRIYAIKYGGPLWVLAFLCVWYPPPQQYPMLVGLHFTVALCFYDGMLTYVEVNHSAMLADMTTDAAVRARANSYSAICAAIGSLSSFFGHLYWDSQYLDPFRNFAIILGLIALLAFEFTVFYMPIELQRDKKKYKLTSHVGALELGTGEVHEDLAPPPTSTPIGNPQSTLGFAVFIRQISQHRNFLLFCCVTTLQVFDCTFEKNFLPLFLRQFSGNALSSEMQSLVVSLSFVLPWACTVITTPVVQRIGVYGVVKVIFGVRIMIAGVGMAAALLQGRTSWLFLLVNRVASECICRLTPLILSDLTDEDVHLQQRDTSLSASIIGSSGAVGKIGQSLAPMLGYALFTSGKEIESTHVGATNSGGLLSKYAISLLIAGVPLAVVIAQSLIWQQFSLHGKYLQKVKLSREMKLMARDK